MIKWIAETFVIDPLLLLFIINVLAVPMFDVQKSNFTTCLIISIVANIILVCGKWARKSQ